MRSLSDSPIPSSAPRAAAAFQRRKHFMFSAVTNHRAKSRRTGRGAGRSSGGNLSTAGRRAACLIRGTRIYPWDRGDPRRVRFCSFRGIAEAPPQGAVFVQSAGSRIDSHGVRMTHKECGYFSFARFAKALFAAIISISAEK